MALKNSLAESHATLGDKNDAAAHLRAREAIVNQDYGDVAANRKTSIAFADEAALGPAAPRLVAGGAGDGTGRGHSDHPLRRLRPRQRGAWGKGDAVRP
ncbi:MAG: hypothetical protein LBH76_09500 [Propionibacteriaceae bacterium]|nr:hypothetical protein [Propionibacteriaceae bacterium]